MCRYFMHTVVSNLTQQQCCDGKVLRVLFKEKTLEGNVMCAELLSECLDVYAV